MSVSIMTLNTSSPDQVTFAIHKGGTLGECAKEIANKMGKPDQWMSVLKELVKENGFESIHDPRLSKIAAYEDDTPQYFTMPEKYKTAYISQQSPQAALNDVIQSDPSETQFGGNWRFDSYVSGQSDAITGEAIEPFTIGDALREQECDPMDPYAGFEQCEDVVDDCHDEVVADVGEIESYDSLEDIQLYNDAEVIEDSTTKNV